MPTDPINWNYPLEDSAFGRILIRTAERVKALSLDSIPAAKVRVQKLAWAPPPSDPPGENDLLPPYVIVSPRPEIVNWRDGTNEKDYPVYGVMISVVLAAHRDLTKGIGLQLSWRQKIRRAFHNKSQGTWPDLQLADGEMFLHSYIESGDQFIEQAIRMQFDAQYWLVRVQTTETRT